MKVESGRTRSLSRERSRPRKRRLTFHDHFHSLTPNALERFVSRGDDPGHGRRAAGRPVRPHHLLRPRPQLCARAHGGPAHFAACRDRLYTLQPQAVTPDFEELCAFLKLRLRKRALLIFLTALDDPFLAESFITSSELLARQHLLLVNTLPPRRRPACLRGCQRPAHRRSLPPARRTPPVAAPARTRKGSPPPRHPLRLFGPGKPCCRSGFSNMRRCAQGNWYEFPDFRFQISD